MFLKSMSCKALQPSITTLNEALTACERGEWWDDLRGTKMGKRRGGELGVKILSRKFFFGGRVLKKNDSLVTCEV